MLGLHIHLPWVWKVSLDSNVIKSEIHRYFVYKPLHTLTTYTHTYTNKHTYIYMCINLQYFTLQSHLDYKWSHVYDKC